MSLGERHIEEIREQGWTDMDFMLSEGDRAEFARLANLVIGIALEDDSVEEALRYPLNPGHQPSERAGTFSLIRGGRNSADGKISLHTGFYSRYAANVVLPQRQQPKDLQQFWQANSEMLEYIEGVAMSMTYRLGAEALRSTVFPPGHRRRNVHLRTVRYIDALTEPVGTEVVSGHADLGLMTLHLYETHGGWFHAAPYETGLIDADDSPERRAAIRTIRSNMRPLDQREGFAPFFFGTNWHSFSIVPDRLRNLPACYHAGIRPDQTLETVSPYATEVTGGNEDRVSVISFMHAHGDLLKKGVYKSAPVNSCRPPFEV